MSLEAPRLDDRSYNDLVEEAMRLIPLYCPEWTDHNPSDPGITLIELFAWMTDLTLYRLNRVPDKHYVKFMELIGMELRAPEPSYVPISFLLTAPQQSVIKIESGTAVATVRTEVDPAIVFTTDSDAEIRLPSLYSVMTSSKSAIRDFIPQNLKQLSDGFGEISIFKSNPPEPDDALYIGFANDMSHHIIGIGIEVDVAEGAGIRTDQPPYVWEAIGDNDNSDWELAEIDYDGTRGFNRSGSFQLHLPAMRKDTIHGENCYWVRCRMVAEEGKPIYQVSPRINRLLVESWGVTTRASNVSLVKDEVVGRSDGTSGQRFYLTHTPVVPRQSGETLLVRTTSEVEELWQEVSDFADSKADHKHYMIDNLTGEIRLAPALPQRDGSIQRYGAIPPKGSVLIMQSYRHGGGQIGNVGRNALTVLKTGLPYIDRVTNRIQAIGGLDVENLEDCKLRVPGHLRSLGRAVTPQDFEYLALEAASGNVSRVRCLQANESNPGEIQLLVIPRIPQFQGFISPESLRLQAPVREQIESYLNERRMLGTRLIVREPEYQWIRTEVELQSVSRINPQQLQDEVIACLYEFLNPLVGGENRQGWVFGRSVTIGDIFAALRNVSGVEIVRSVALVPVYYVDGNFEAGEATDRIDIDEDSIIVSYEHEVFVSL